MFVFALGINVRKCCKHEPQNKAAGYQEIKANSTSKNPSQINKIIQLRKSVEYHLCRSDDTKNDKKAGAPYYVAKHHWPQTVLRLSQTLVTPIEGGTASNHGYREECDRYRGDSKKIGYFVKAPIASFRDVNLNVERYRTKESSERASRLAGRASISLSNAAPSLVAPSDIPVHNCCGLQNQAIAAFNRNLPINKIFSERHWNVDTNGIWRSKDCLLSGVDKGIQCKNCAAGSEAAANYPELKPNALELLRIGAP